MRKNQWFDSIVIFTRTDRTEGRQGRQVVGKCAA